MSQTGEQQYLALCQRILDEGIMIQNTRTGKGCLTVINADFEYDCSKGELPLLTTRKSYWKAAIAEMLGYLRGYQNAADFRALGCKTWDANANLNAAWLKNPHRLGEDDLGRCYGVQGRHWQNPEGKEVDQLRKIVDVLMTHEDNRRLIMTFHNPGELDRACLDACMHTHTFSVLDGTLYLTSYQRSIDVPLGLAFNMVQVSWLLRIMAHITGLKPGKAFHKLVNCHLYDDQIDLMRDVQLKRTPYDPPTLHISDAIKTFDDLENMEDIMQHFTVEGYTSHEPIKYPFAV